MTRSGASPARNRQIHIALLTGGGDRPYAFGLATALMSRGVAIDLIASDELDAPEFHNQPLVTFLNLRGDQRPEASLGAKISRVITYYFRLIAYAAKSRPRVFHILWNNKFDLIDRVALMLYYRLLGKRIVLTIHNVNTAKRDSVDSAFNRLTLKCQYLLAHHLFVHTERMKVELTRDFGVRSSVVTVVPFGINNAVPNTILTPQQARETLGIGSTDKTILFFGNIAPYKGLEYLVEAFQKLLEESRSYRLLIAGRPKGSEHYWRRLEQAIGRIEADRVIQHIEYIADQSTEHYFKAADVLVLPYTEIFQSGVLFLAYSFGLPAIASEVGSLRDDIIEGSTGFLFKPRDPAALTQAIRSYFSSDLFLNLPARRQEIVAHVNERHSWDTVSQMTAAVYNELVNV
jgi:glycosyltransferase involved in cell wall biosynthesis